MEHLWQDVRYGARQLLNQRGFTAVAVLTLALGIGANVAIFNTLDALLLKELPVTHPEEIYQVLSDRDGNSIFSNPLWEQVRDRQTVFSGVFAWSTPTFNLARGGEVRNARGLWASGEFFSTLGVRPQIGRLLTAADDHRDGNNAVAVLGYSFWQREYGGSADVIGHDIFLDGHPFQIVGVAPRQFFGMTVGNTFDVAVPLTSERIVRGENSALDRRTTWWMYVAGRLKPGTTPAQADAGLAVISKAIFEATVNPTSAEQYQKEYANRLAKTRPAGTGVSYLRRRYEKALWLLMGIVSLVLLIACANIANLLLARAAARQKEMGVRLALGASRLRLIRQLLTESLLIAAAGTLAAAPLSALASRLLVQQISPARSQWFLELTPDWRVMGFIAGVALLTTILFGLAPALNATRVSLAEAMKQADATERRQRFGLGRLLVVAQVAVSMVLVAGAALLLHTFYNLASVDTGFEANRVLLVELDIRRVQTAPEGRLLLYDQLLRQMRGLPGVTAASQSDITPISGSSWNGDVEVPGYVKKSREDSVSFFNSVAPDYFRTMGTPLLAGRDFAASDVKNAPKVAIVNDAFAAKFFPGRNPVGEQYFETPPGRPRFATQIVGLVKSAKYQSLREEPLPTVYIPCAQQDASAYTNLLLRTPSDPSVLVPLVNDAITKITPQAALHFTTLNAQVDDSLRQDRLLAMLSGVFGGLALLLSAVGLYGLLAHSVARRRREIGIRMALGSTPQGVLRLILGDGLRLATAGALLGILASLAATRVLATFLYGVDADDPFTLGVAGALLVAIAAMACASAARRAARIEPWAAIRHE